MVGVKKLLSHFNLYRKVSDQERDLRGRGVQRGLADLRLRRQVVREPLRLRTREMRHRVAQGGPELRQEQMLAGVRRFSFLKTRLDFVFAAMEP